MEATNGSALALIYQEVNDGASRRNSDIFMRYFPIYLFLSFHECFSWSILESQPIGATDDTDFIATVEGETPGRKYSMRTFAFNAPDRLKHRGL